MNKLEKELENILKENNMLSKNLKYNNPSIYQQELTHIHIVTITGNNLIMPIKNIILYTESIDNKRTEYFVGTKDYFEREISKETFEKIKKLLNFQIINLID